MCLKKHVLRQDKYATKDVVVVMKAERRLLGTTQIKPSTLSNLKIRAAKRAMRDPEDFF